MEFEQIIKRLDWLDEEHRKDKNNINELLQRVAGLEGDLKAANNKFRDLTNQMTRVSTSALQVEQGGTNLAQQRANINKYIEDLEKKHQAQHSELDKRTQLQFGNLNKSIEQINEFVTKATQERADQEEKEKHRNILFMDWEKNKQGMIKAVDDTLRLQKSFEESRRQDNKHLVDLQADLDILRKRFEDSRRKNDHEADNVRRIDARLTELLTAESERRESQLEFLEAQSRLQMERDQSWKKWEELLNNLEKQSETSEHNLQEWDAAQRALKHTRETYEDIIQKFDRRINEITEMQRLSEDHFRQEWVTFKADDLKRWTSFNLAQDENHKDTRSVVAKNESRLSTLEDLAQTQQDVLQQTRDANEQLLQGMLAQIHELLSAYERIATK